MLGWALRQLGPCLLQGEQETPYGGGGEMGPGCLHWFPYAPFFLRSSHPFVLGINAEVPGAKH